jgi:hypothetical protein
MAVAMIYPEAKRGELSQLKNSTGMGFDRGYLSQARTVLSGAHSGSTLTTVAAESATYRLTIRQSKSCSADADASILGRFPYGITVIER